MTEFAIRRATADDAAAIARIYNLGSAAQPAANLVTWQVDADDRREWLASLEEQGYPVFVATVAAQPGTVDGAPAEAATAGDPAGTAATGGALAGADPAGTAAAAGAAAGTAEVVGFAAYFQFVVPAIYYGTVEDSIYLDPAAQGRGIGSALLSAVVEHARANDYVQTMITYITDMNEASLALHRKFGFVETGRMPNIHTKNGERIGLVHLQLDFPRAEQSGGR